MTTISDFQAKQMVKTLEKNKLTLVVPSVEQND
jgi:hypothetical protein